MVSSRRTMVVGDDFTKKCQNCRKCKAMIDDANHVVGHACLVDGEPLGGRWPTHITTCNKFIRNRFISDIPE